MLRAGYYSISRGATNFCQLYIFRSGTAHWASVTHDSVGCQTVLAPAPALTAGCGDTSYHRCSRRMISISSR